MVPGISLKMIQDDRIWQSYAMWYDAMALSYKLFALSFSLLKSLFFFLYGHFLHNAQTKIAIVYMREQTWGTRDYMIPIWYGMYAMEGVYH